MDFLLGNLIYYLFQNQKSGNYYRTYEGIMNDTSKVFIFGSSIANHHIVPSELEKNLGLPSYNLGKDGMDIVYHYSALYMLTQRHKPEYVLLCVTPKELSCVEEHDRISEIFPFVVDFPELLDSNLYNDKLLKLKFLSKIFPFNSKITTIIKGYFIKEKADNQKGYVALSESKSFVNLEKKITFSKDTSIDSLRLQSFNGIVNLTKENNIKLIIILSPYFNKDDTLTRSISIIKQRCENQNISFLNYLNDTSFVGHTELFFDEGHLNNKGAILLTQKISSQIKSH